MTRLAGTGNAVTTTLTYEPTFNHVASIALPKQKQYYVPPDSLPPRMPPRKDACFP